MIQLVAVPNKYVCFEKFRGGNCPIAPPLVCGPALGPPIITLMSRSNGGFKVGGARRKTKKGGPLMTSSYSANRDKHFDQA